MKDDRDRKERLKKYEAYLSEFIRDALSDLPSNQREALEHSFELHIEKPLTIRFTFKTA